MRPDHNSTTAITTIEPEPEITSMPANNADEDIFNEDVTGQQPHIGFGSFQFRFNLANFRLGRNFSARRFSIAEAAVLLMMAYLASRGLGIIRQSIFNALFGTSDAANAYYAAFRLPDFLFNLIAGGALANAFVPVFVSFDKDNGRQAAWRLTSLVFNIMLVGLTFIVLVGEFLAPVFVTHILVPGYPASEQNLTASLTRIMLIQPLIMGLGTVATAVLSSKRQFLLPAIAIAIYNIGLIGGLICTLLFPSIGIYGPTYGVLLASCCHVAIQVPGLVKEGLRYSWVWDLRDAGLRQVLNLLGPNALIVILGSAAFIADTAFASYLPDQASLSAQHNAYMLYFVPVALLAQAIAQAALPQLSSLAARGTYWRLKSLAKRIIGAALLLGIPTTLLLCFLGKPAIHLLFQHGAFKQHATELTSLALIGYAVGLPGVIAGDLIARTFFALKDARVPLFTNAFNFAAHIGLIIYLTSMFSGQNAILAIPLATAGSATAEAILLAGLLFLRFRSKKLQDGVNERTPETVEQVPAATGDGTSKP